MEGTGESDYTYEWTNESRTLDDFGTDGAYRIFKGSDGLYEVLVTMVAPCTWTTTSFFDIDEDVCELTIPNVISPNGSVNGTP